MKRPLEQDYTSIVAYTRALEEYCDALSWVEQEPVAWRYRAATFWNRDVHWRYLETLEGTEGLQGLKPLYTTPPQRTWVGLTNEEREEIALEIPIDAVSITEARLRSKNT
jgi:hypothetical protein